MSVAAEARLPIAWRFGDEAAMHDRITSPAETIPRAAGSHLVAGENLRLLLQHQETILRTPSYYFAPAGEIGERSRGCHVSIGHLLELWQNLAWIQPCPECRGEAYINAILRLNRKWRWEGGCITCGERVGASELLVNGCRAESLPPFPESDDPIDCYGALASQAMTFATEEKTAEPKFIRGERPTFTTDRQLVGRWTPDLVVEPAVDPIPLATLLEILRGGSGTVMIRDPLGQPHSAYEWSSGVLRDRDGHVQFRLDGTRIRDRHDQVAYYWDSLYLSAPDHGYLFEMHRTSRLRPRSAHDPDLAWREGAILRRAYAFDHFRGVNVMQTNGEFICRPDNEVVLRAESRVPPVVAFLAWQHVQAQEGG